MKIKHYLYNTFIIESDNKKLVIDPGVELYILAFLKNILPKSEWKNTTHIFVTHGDPDHYWNTDRLALETGATIICNKTMLSEQNGDKFLLAPRKKGLSFTTKVNNVHSITQDQKIIVDDMNITGIKSVHGPLGIKFGPFSKVEKPGPKERIGWGAIGFKIELNGKTVVNMGDTIFLDNEWQNISNPDLLMVPIGGRFVNNTMDEKQALKTVEIIKPKQVVPCHYNCRAFFSKNYNYADDIGFKKNVEKMGIKCDIMELGDEIII
jgi:L-ascorbate metabolism protein UlaG (beta-lactamase superfamily)